MSNNLKVLVKLSNGNQKHEKVSKKDAISTAWKLANTINMMNSMLRISVEEESHFLVSSNEIFSDLQKEDRTREEILEMFKFYFGLPLRQATNQYTILSLAHTRLKGDIISSICDFVMFKYNLPIEDFYSEDNTSFINSKSDKFIYVLNMDNIDNPSELGLTKEYDCYITPGLIKEYFDETGDMAVIDLIDETAKSNDVKDLIKLHLTDMLLDDDTRLDRNYRINAMSEITRILNGELTYSCGFFSLPDGSNTVSKETLDDVINNTDNYALIQYKVERVIL